MKIMKKIKKFLSVLLSSLMLAGGKLTGNKASAINEKTLTATFAKPLIRTESSLDCGNPDRVEFRYKSSIGNYS